jgi:hypothetical protein
LDGQQSSVHQFSGIFFFPVLFLWGFISTLCHFHEKGIVIAEVRANDFPKLIDAQDADKMKCYDAHHFGEGEGKGTGADKVKCYNAIMLSVHGHS